MLQHASQLHRQRTKVHPTGIKCYRVCLLQGNNACHPCLDVLQTFKEADLAGDGHISPDEWQILVQKHPNVISYMTLPVLKELTKKYPSFIFNENRK